MTARNCASLGTLFVTLIAAGNFGCSSGTNSPAPISVSVSASVTTLQAGASAQITATLTNDSSNKGVTWTVACSVSSCGTVSPTATASGSATTYTAPSNPPSAGLTVTITATSFADTSKSASAAITVTVPAITVMVAPSSATLSPGATAQFTATVSNDSANKGVTWTVVCSASPCGTVSLATTASGAATTYTAPTTEPAGDLFVTITATSVTNTSVSGTANITVSGITVSVAPNRTTVAAGATGQFTATVTNDPSNMGVTWAVSCSATPCGTVSPTATASGAATTYTAPTTPPASNLSVTLTATSVSNTTASGSALATVPAIAVTVSPISALLPAGISQQFTATVLNTFPTNTAVNWVLTQNGAVCAPATCGTLSGATSNPVIYTAPATVSANASVALTVTSAEDTTKSAVATIMLTIGTVEIVPASIDFGRVVKHHSSAPQTTTLTNTAKTTLSINSITMTGSQYFSQTNNCGTSVAAGGSCTLTVTFTPQGLAFFTGGVSISDGSTDSPQQVSLSGTGVRFLTNQAAVRSELANTRSAMVPSPTGPIPVGTRVMDLVDSSRQDPYLNNATKRELLVRFWYPASLSQGCKLAEYTSPRVWSYFSKLAGVSLPEVRTNSCLNAPIADGVYPIVVFTPGFTATFTDYTFIFEDLASRGYVVASVDHTYEATAVEFPDGRFAKSVFGSHLANILRGDDRALTLATSVRLGDLKFVLNALTRLNVSKDSPFSGKLDTCRIALAGHSLGGLTAILGVERAPGFKAGIILDSGVPDGLITPTESPVLILAAGREQWSENDVHLWNQLRGPRFAVNLKDAEHVTPTDEVWLAKDVIKTGEMGQEKTIAAVRDYIAAFLDANLLGKPMDSLLTGPSSEYPDAEVTTQEQLLSDGRR